MLRHRPGDTSQRNADCRHRQEFHRPATKPRLDGCATRPLAPFMPDAIGYDQLKRTDILERQDVFNHKPLVGLQAAPPGLRPNNPSDDAHITAQNLDDRPLRHRTCALDHQSPRGDVENAGIGPLRPRQDPRPRDDPPAELTRPLPGCRRGCRHPDRLGSPASPIPKALVRNGFISTQRRSVDRAPRPTVAGIDVANRDHPPPPRR